jgi:hypothetical protein
MACQQRTHYPGFQLSGATIDIARAYNQYPQSVETTKLQATQIYIPDGTGGKIVLVILWLVGIFGFSRAGHVFCILSRAVHELHNHRQSPERSKIYVDDGILISPSHLIRESMDEYSSNVTAIFGKEAINKDKVSLFENGLEAIGWSFDFISWTMTPKKKGLAKLLILLFEIIPPGKRVITQSELDKITGTLTWYALGIPSGKSYLSSLFACNTKRSSTTGKVFLTDSAIADLLWWRALVLAIHIRPSIIGARIESLRINVEPDYFMRTDASTTIGGGAYISHKHGGDEISMDGSMIRWTTEEFCIFKEMNISINTLEYYTAIYYVMLWAETFVGKVVYLECDNSSAVSWLLKQRTKSRQRNYSADILVKIFSMFCLQNKITVIGKHIAGVDNNLADYKSRCDLPISLFPQVNNAKALQVGSQSSQRRRADLLRTLLSNCLKPPDKLLFHETLRALMSQLGALGIHIAVSEI